MKRIYSIFYFIIYSTLCTAQSQYRGGGVVNNSGYNKSEIPEIKNIALVIGTDNYQSNEWPHLDNPVNDAKSVANQLENYYDFTVTLLTNPNAEEILKNLEILRKSFEEKNNVNINLVIFIAGHGGWDKLTSGYIVPKDAKSQRDDPYRQSYITHNNLRQYIENINIMHCLVIIDACFGGGFDQKITNRRGGNSEEVNEMSADFINEKLNLRGRRYMASGGKQYVPDGEPGNHSKFAQRIINTLEKCSKEERLFTFDNLYYEMRGLSPVPCGGDFGINDPNSDFILIPNSLKKRKERNDLINTRKDSEKLLYNSYNYSVFKENNMYGLRDNDGNIIMPANYDNIDEFREKLALVRKGKLFGYINNTGVSVIPPTYDRGLWFSEGLAAVRKGKKWGFIDKNGKVAIDFKYEKTKSFADGLAQIKLDGKYGYIDKNGKIIIPAIYDALHENAGIGIKCKQNGKWGIIDFTGKEIVPNKYRRIGGRYRWSTRLYNDFNLIKSGNKWGTVSANGAITVPILYNKIIYSRNGTAIVKNKRKYGLISMYNDILIETKYSRLREELWGYSACLNHKWGVLDKNGHEIIPLKYERISLQSDSTAIVKFDGKCGLINQNDKFIIKCKYDNMYAQGKNFIVFQNKKRGLIDKNGRQLLSIKYDRIQDISESRHPYSSDGKMRFIISENKKYGIVNDSDNTIIPKIYGNIRSLYYADHLFAVQKDGKWGVIDLNGNTIIKFMYDSFVGDYSLYGDGYKAIGFYISMRKGKKIINLDENGKAIKG